MKRFELLYGEKSVPKCNVLQHHIEKLEEVKAQILSNIQIIICAINTLESFLLDSGHNCPSQQNCSKSLPSMIAASVTSKNSQCNEQVEIFRNEWLGCVTAIREKTRSSNLTQRMYTLYRMTDLLIKESLSTHLALYYDTFYARICGISRDATEQNKANDSMDMTTRLCSDEESLILDIFYSRRFYLRKANIIEPPEPFVHAKVDFSIANNGNISSVSIHPQEEDCLKTIHGMWLAFTTALDSMPRVVRPLRSLFVHNANLMYC